MRTIHGLHVSLITDFFVFGRRESLYTYTRKLEGMKEDIRAYDEKNDKTKVEVCSAEGRQERKM